MRLLTAGSLVRVQQVAPKEKPFQKERFFLWPQIFAPNPPTPRLHEAVGGASAPACVLLTVAGKTVRWTVLPLRCNLGAAAPSTLKRSWFESNRWLFLWPQIFAPNHRPCGSARPWAARQLSLAGLRLPVPKPSPRPSCSAVSPPRGRRNAADGKTAGRFSDLT